MTTIDRLRHPSISEAVTRAAGINPEPIPSGGVTRWTAQARQDRVPRRAADLMEKRAWPRSKRPRRGKHSPPIPSRKLPCVATARSWPTAPGPVTCRRLGPVYQPGASPLRYRAVTGTAPALWPHVRAAKALGASFG